MIADHQKRALLGKRVVCDEQPNSAARVTDAVDCINYLASIRGTPCQIWLNYSSFRTSGTAEIDGHSLKKTQSDWLALYFIRLPTLLGYHRLILTFR